MQWSLLFFIIFGAFFLNAVTGFGGGLLSVPFLALLFPITLISPLVNVLGLTQNTFLIRSVYRDIKFDVLVPLVIGNALGSVVGVLFLTSTENSILTKLLGVLIIAYAIYTLVKPTFTIVTNTYLAIAVGVLSGFLSATYAVGGPPLVIFLSGILHNKTNLRATMIGFFWANGLMQVPLMAFSGIITQQVLIIALIAIPLLIAASWLGHRIHLKIPETTYRRVISAVLVIAGILLVLR